MLAVMILCGARAGFAAETITLVSIPPVNPFDPAFEITFPVKGGNISGKLKSGVKETCSTLTDGPDCKEGYCTAVITGTYKPGKAYGVLTMNLNWTCPKKDTEKSHNKDSNLIHFYGEVYPDGTALVQSSWKATYSPTKPKACNKNLDSYSAEARKKIMGKLLDMVSEELIKNLTITFTEIDKKLWEKTGKGTGLSKSVKDYVKSKVKPIDGKALRKSIVSNSMLSAKMLKSLANNLSNTLSFLEIAGAASDGAYGKAAVMAVLEYAAGASNAAAVLIFIGQATVADYEKFSKAAHDEFFRKFYVQLYYDGERPAVTEDPAGDKKLRMKHFYELAMDYIEGKGTLGVQFINMLVDFAYYDLEKKIKPADFTVFDDEKGNRTMKTEARVVLGALFSAYEQVYLNDLKAEKVRQLAVEQTKKRLEAADKMEDAMGKAEAGDFLGVWPKETYEKLLCNVVDGLRDMNLIPQE